MFKSISLLLIVLACTGCKTNPPITPQVSVPEYGKILLISNVDSALIFIDNSSTGKFTPETLTTTVGTHLIKLEKKDYVPESKIITVEKDSTISLNFILKLALASKIVLIEDFANVSCIPCATSNKVLESVKSGYGVNKLLAIKYPTNFPSPTDPFYTANPTDCNARMSYYNILVAPTTKVDGKLTPTSTDSISVKTKIDERLLLIPKFKITVNDSLGIGNYNIKIKVETIDTTGVDFTNLVIHTVAVESVIEFATPPGSNGETKFYDVMRKMLPSNSGEALTYSTAGVQYFNRQVILSPGWNASKIETIVFIQNKATKEILQTGSTF